MDKTGEKMYALAQRLFPICRSITGEGFRKSLKILDKVLGGGPLNLYSIQSGTKVFDWLVPAEWSIKDAYILTPSKEKICDFKKNNLHILNYSSPINATLTLEELLPHLYSNENLPHAIPYVTSYYERRWGFCLSYDEKSKLKKGKYKVFIDSKHDEKGVLNYADFKILSTCKSKDEILISTYLCHPSMANNELSGPVVAVFLAKWLKTLKKRKYNYRFIIIPETIGSIVYLSRHLKELKEHVRAGFVLSCLGDDMAYSLIHSPNSCTLSDKVAFHILKDKPNFKEYSFVERGSDERQYNAPLINLGVVGVCRSKYGEYKEYHSSFDDMNFISAKGLVGGLKALQEMILSLEMNEIYESTCFCEPNLGSRGLIATINKGLYPKDMMNLRHFLAFCDGKNDVIDIATKLGVKAYELENIIQNLLEFDLIKEKR